MLIRVHLWLKPETVLPHTVLRDSVVNPSSGGLGLIFHGGTESCRAMILKEADDRSVEIQKLREWSQDARIPEDVREKLEMDLRIRLAGAKGEDRSAYELEFHYGNRPDWVIIHDLRLAVNGRTTQIDHLLINPALECYVIETKHYADGFAINERGEFTIFHQGRPRGIDSPHEQNKKHIAVLQEAFDSGLVPLPKKLGVTIRPKLINLILASPKARISLPKGSEEDWSHVVKADSLKSWIVNRVNDMHLGQLFVGGMKMVSEETLMEVGHSIVALHQPAEVNPYKIVERYGLSRYLNQVPAPTPVPAKAAPVAPSKSMEAVEEGAPCCQGCGVGVEFKVVAFCRLPQNVGKFGGKILCRACQVAPTPTAPVQAKPAAKSSGPVCGDCGVPVDDKVAFFCRLPKNKEKFGGRVLCRECQAK